MSPSLALLVLLATPMQADKSDAVKAPPATTPQPPPPTGYQRYGNNMTSYSPEELDKQIRDRRFELTTFVGCLAIGVLVFGVLTVFIEFWFMSKAGALRDDGFAKLVALTIIGTLAVFLIVAGYGQTQIAAVVGLFGTALGYMMGRTDKPGRSETPPTSP